AAESTPAWSSASGRVRRNAASRPCDRSVRGTPRFRRPESLGSMEPHERQPCGGERKQRRQRGEKRAHLGVPLLQRELGIERLVNLLQVGGGARVVILRVGDLRD